MDKFYNIPYWSRPRRSDGPYNSPTLPGRDLRTYGEAGYPHYSPSTPYSPPPTPSIQYKKIEDTERTKEHETPSRKVVVHGWRYWEIKILDTHEGISLDSPVRNRAAVLEAEECKETAHCGPSCKPPCRDCQCGVYLRYKPPGLDELSVFFNLSKGQVSSLPISNTKLPIWFSCEALGKLKYGDIGSRSEKVQPLFAVIPPIDDDTFRKLNIYLPVFFGPQLQLLRLEKEEIENLKWGEVWEE